MKIGDLITKTRKKNNSVMKLRKAESYLHPIKIKSNNDESSNDLYDINRRNILSWGITKKSVEIISSKNLNIYNEFGEEKNEETERLNPKIEKEKTNRQNNKNISKNISKSNILLINSKRYNKEKEKNNKKEDILFTINNDKIKNDFDKIENILYSTIRSKDEDRDNFRSKKIQYIMDKEEDDEEYSDIFDLKIFYDGKGHSIKISKSEIFSKLLSDIQKILSPKYKLRDYDILYKLKILDKKALNNEKLCDIIEPNSSPAFYLRKKNITKDNKNTTVIIENFPSFTDLSAQLNKFFKQEESESNFTVDNKGNICKVNFNESEKAFSLIVFLTRLKKMNPIFKRLKINMDYKLNVVIDPKKYKRKPIKLVLPLINKKSFDSIKTKKVLGIKQLMTLKNINNYKINKDIDHNLNIEFNSTIRSRNNKRYESCLTLGNKELSNFHSKLIKNKSYLENNNKYLKSNFKKGNSKINYTIESERNRNSFNNNDEPFLSEASEEKNSKMSRLKSTNCIIDLNRIKNIKKNTLKNINLDTYNNDDKKNFSSKTKPKKKSNFYNIIDKNISKKYKL